MLKKHSFEDKLRSDAEEELRTLRETTRDPARKKTWSTANGREIRYCNMSNTHLLNTIHFLRRAEFSEAVGQIAFASRLEIEMPDEVACELGDRKVEELYPAYKYLMKEARRRKLAVNRWCPKCQYFHAEGQKYCKEEFCAPCARRHPVPVSVFHAAKMRCNAEFAGEE